MTKTSPPYKYKTPTSDVTSGPVRFQPKNSLSKQIRHVRQMPHCFVTVKDLEGAIPVYSSSDEDEEEEGEEKLGSMVADRVDMEIKAAR